MQCVRFFVINFVILQTIKSVHSFNYSHYEIISNIIHKTFLNCMCVNLYANVDIYGSKIIKYLHNTNFLFVHISPNEINEECGFLFLAENFKELSFFQNVIFEKVPRVLYFMQEHSVSVPEMYKNHSNVFKDKDFVIVEFSSMGNVNIYKQSRYSFRLISHDYYSLEPIFLSEDYVFKYSLYESRRINVVTFDCPVFNSIQIKDGKQVLRDGIETRIFKEIAKKLNFRWNLLVPTDGKRWGTVFPNKTIDGGILKYLNTERADIGFCSLWVEQSKFSSIVLSHYWEFICLKFLTPKPKIITSNYSSIFKPLKIYIWVMILVSLVIISVINFIVKRVERVIIPNNSNKETNLAASFTIIFGILVMAEHPNNYRESNSSRHLFLWWSVFALVVVTVYSSSLISHLTYPEFFPMLETIKDIVEAGYYWGTPYDPPIKYLYFKEEENVFNQKFADRFKFETETDNRTNRILQGNYSTFVKCIDRAHFMEVQDVPADILHELRATRYCMNYFMLALGFRKGFPYAEAANRVISILVQSGITKYWVSRLFETEYATNTFAKAYEYKIPPEDLELSPLTLQNLQSLFLIYALGLTVSVMVFLAEMVLGR